MHFKIFVHPPPPPPRRNFSFLLVSTEVQHCGIPPSPPPPPPRQRNPGSAPLMYSIIAFQLPHPEWACIQSSNLECSVSKWYHDGYFTSCCNFATLFCSLAQASFCSVSPQMINFDVVVFSEWCSKELIFLLMLHAEASILGGGGGRLGWQTTYRFAPPPPPIIFDNLKIHNMQCKNRFKKHCKALQNH